MRQPLARGAACALVSATAVLFAAEARAGPRGFELEYSAPSECSDEASFVGDTRARLGDRGAELSDDRRFRIRIEGGRGAYHGALETLEPASVREVTGESCEEVVRALAVFFALALSPPNADAAFGGEPSVPSTTKAQSESRLSRARPPSRPREAIALPVSRRGDRHVQLGADVHALLAAGMAPEIAPGVALAAGLSLPIRPPFRWVAHVGGVFAFREDAVLDGAFDFIWAAARVDAGAALDIRRFRWSIGPVIHAGMLQVAARHLPSAERQSSFWGDAGVFVRADYSVTAAFALALMIDGAIPIQRKMFGVRGVEALVYETPPAVGLVFFGASFRR